MSSSNKVAIKLGPDFQGTARLINTMVWGDPNSLAQVDNGSLWLLGLHATQHGSGLQVRQGEVTAVNVNYTGRGGHLTVAESKAKATLIGNITRGGPLVINGKPMSEGPQPGSITTIGNLSR
jgi:hypothetical protein